MRSRTPAGVVTNVYGRRGWDDFVIRGQRASESIFADGLLVDSNNRVAQELFGAERVEVLKGPASVLFGAVQPGGLVNIVSKRPRPELFGELGLTVGNFGFRQVTADVGTPLAKDSKAAFRLNALAMDSDDPTDSVWYRNRWIAPSLTLGLRRPHRLHDPGQPQRAPLRPPAGPAGERHAGQQP